MAQCPDQLSVEPVDGWVRLSGSLASMTINPAAALKTAQELMRAAQEAMEQRESALSN